MRLLINKNEKTNEDEAYNDDDDDDDAKERKFRVDFFFFNFW